MAVSFSGEVAWELHIPNDLLTETYQAIRTAGAKPFGLYATESMRLEKGYRHWKADLITEFNPVESGLARFIAKKEYIGKAAVEAQPIRRKFVSFIVDTDRHPAHAGDSIMANGEVVGTITSAGWGHRTGKNIAMGFVDPAHSSIGTDLAIWTSHGNLAATVCEPCLYDPDNTLVRQP